MDRKFILMAIPLFLLLLIGSAEAVVPKQIQFSGVRTTSSGAVEAGLTHTNINFTVFDQKDGGRVLNSRLINITTNRQGFWFTNYSTAGFDTDTDMWLAINNTSPRLFIGPSPYSNMYAKLNESNTFNSTQTLFGNGGSLRSNILGLFANATSGINASAILYGIIPQAVLDTARTWTAVQTFNNNISTSGGLLVNNTGGVNASAIGFGTLPSGVTPVYRDGTLASTNGARLQFGHNSLVLGGSGGVSEVVVNLSQGFTCVGCYAVTFDLANGTAGIVNMSRVVRMNASQFNISIDSATTNLNVSWIAVGY